MNTLHILDVHQVMEILYPLLSCGPSNVVVSPELLIEEVIYAAQQDGNVRQGNLAGIIIVREDFEQSVFMDIVHEFIMEAAFRLARELSYNHIDGYIVNWMLMPNGRDLILEERTQNGRIRTQGGAHH